MSILTVATPNSVRGSGLIVVQAVAPIDIFSVDDRYMSLKLSFPPATISTWKSRYYEARPRLQVNHTHSLVSIDYIYFMVNFVWLYVRLWFRG